MATQSPTNPDNRRLYAGLAVLFVVAVVTQGSLTLDVVRYLRGDYPGRPVSLGDPWPSIAELIPAAEKAGLRAGDRVIAIEGRAPRGRKDLQQPLHSKLPGQTIAISVERNGQTENFAVPLFRFASQRKLADIITFLVMPWFCIALGFWVAAVRPRDKRAWMMLGILLGMGQVQNIGLDPWGWPALIGATSVAYTRLAQSAWAICIMLFGFFFPHRGRFDQWFPWIKWVTAVPLVVTGLWDAFREIGLGISYRTASMLPTDLLPSWLQNAIMMSTISLFFFAVGERYGDRSLDRDDRRRLTLLYCGCTLAFTPGLLRLLYAWIVHHRNPGDDAMGIWAEMAMTLLPLTLAYVIVVERAMDVRMVVRQGLQYAFARQGVVVVQLLVMSVISGVGLDYLESHRLNPLEQSLLVAGGVMTIVQIRAQADRVRRWVDRRFFREAFNADQILSELGEQVRSILDRDALLETVTRKISESLHVERIVVMLQDGGFFRPALAIGYPGSPEIEISSRGPTASELSRSREPLAVTTEQSGEDHKALEQLGAQLLLPLASRKELLGFISLGPKKSEVPYSTSDTSLLRTVAAQTGLALENSRLSEAIAAEVAQRELLNREMEIAREVQQRLFPQTMPDIPSLEYAGHCRPARGVGGDYYDFLTLSSGRLGLAIADVSGKGIPAALLMASLQASVRGQSQSELPGAQPDVAGLMANVNLLVCEASASNRYATFFYGLFDPATRKLVYTNGGHNPPMVLRGSELLLLENGGPPVGLFRASRYVQDEIVLKPGDLLILYTDGVSEAENAAEEEWGEAALISTARACSGLPPSEIITRVMEAADTFAAGAPQHDDMTLVIARVLAA